MLSRVFFLGDAHISDFKECAFSDFKRFCEVLRPGDILCITGDFFNFFFGYHVPRCLRPVLRFFRELSSKGVSLYFAEGNREFFSQRALVPCGFKKVSRFLEIGLTHGRVLVFHGDGLSKKDRGYRIMRAFLRNPATKLLSKLVGGEFVYGVARLFATPPKGPYPELPKEYMVFSKGASRLGYRWIVMGHLHRAEVVEFEGGAYLNPGAWFLERTYLKFEDGLFSLERF